MSVDLCPICRGPLYRRQGFSNAMGTCLRGCRPQIVTPAAASKGMAAPQKSKPPEWIGPDAMLVIWYQAWRQEGGTVPVGFQPRRGETIVGPTRYLEALDVEALMGPLGCRAKIGALQEDLRILRDFAEATEV